jgi:nucleotide-binding universal stress UspA family protein
MLCTHPAEAVAPCKRLARRKNRRLPNSTSSKYVPAAMAKNEKKTHGNQVRPRTIVEQKNLSAQALGLRQWSMRRASPVPVTRITAWVSCGAENWGEEGKTMETATASAKVATRFENILFATDFSAAADQAIPYVKNIAKHYQSKLLALHVRPAVVNPMTQPSTWAIDIEYARSVDQQNRDQLSATFEGLPAEVIIEEGEILPSINKTIQKYNIDLVVIGTRGRTGIGKLLLGSVAEEILRNVTCPVLTVGPHADTTPGTRAEFREILYATDLSPESARAASYAISLAHEFGARLTLLHVVSESHPGDLVTWSDVQESSKELLRKLVEPEAQGLKKLEYFVERGDPAERILDVAHLRQVDLVVLGTRVPKGVPGAATHLPGAIAHKVVARAGCPVLTILH